MSVILSNAFSLGMLSTQDSIIRVKEINLEDVKTLLNADFMSVVGHQSTADILTKLLKINVPVNRASVKLTEKDKLIVFQILTRLEEGRVLTENEVLSLPTKFYLVEFLPPETIEALYHW